MVWGKYSKEPTGEDSVWGEYLEKPTQKEDSLWEEYSKEHIYYNNQMKCLDYEFVII